MRSQWPRDERARLSHCLQRRTLPTRRRATRPEERPRQATAFRITSVLCSNCRNFHTCDADGCAPRIAPIGEINAFAETANAKTCGIFGRNAMNTDRCRRTYERISSGNATSALAMISGRSFGLRSFRAPWYLCAVRPPKWATT